MKKRFLKLAIINPFFHKSARWDSLAYSNFLNNIKKVYDNATELQPNYLTGFYVGEKKNRLIVG